MPIPDLRSYQLDLYNRVRAARGRGARIIVVQGFCGCGKTSVISHICRQAVDKENDVLCMAHRRKLVDQIHDRLNEFQVSHAVLMRGEHFEKGMKVKVASRDTMLSRCMRNEWIGLPTANVVIVDEGHLCHESEGEYRRILNAYPHATILLFSATPVGPDGSGLGPWAQAIECAAPVSQLIRDGYIVPVKCYAPERKKRGNRFLRGMAGDMVESWKQYGEDRPTVAFFSRVQHSIDAVDAYRAEGISAVHVDADTPDEEREKAFEDVAAGRVKILCNVNIVAIGVDVPELSCCQIYCDMAGRVRFLQAVGRIMRPFPGKGYGIIIDHAGTIFKHGFPDEDTEWTLTGNTDELFANRHANGETEKALYCKHCELVYHGDLACPQCGRMPQKPPKSIFAPPPVQNTNEVLVEAERGNNGAYSREEKVKTWFACLNTAKKRNGTVGMAGQIYRQKYKSFPPEDFPMIPARGYEWRLKVTEVFPDFGKRRQ